MTSWTEGREKEDKGNREMNEPGLGNKIRGAGNKVVGETEQGLDNVGDTLSGKQHDLKGNDRDTSTEYEKAAEHGDYDVMERP